MGRAAPWFGISSGIVGRAQLISPLVSIAPLLLGGHLSAQLGKRCLGLAFHGASALVLAAGAGLPGLLVALVLLGAGNGLFETSMKGAALEWERATGRRALNVLHASFSGGAVAGALGVGWFLSYRHARAELQQLLACTSMAVYVAMLMVRFPGVPSGASDTRGARPRHCWWFRAAWPSPGSGLGPAAVDVSFLVCPPLIGWLAELWSLQAALLVVGLSGAGIL